MVRLLLLLFFFLSVLADVVPAASNSPLIFTEELAPVHYTKDNRLVGIATEIVSALFQEINVQPTFHSYPWKRAYLNTLRTPGSFIFTINRTPEREELFQWIGPILKKRTYLYRLASRKDIQLNSTRDLSRYTTAVILGYALTRQLKNMGLTPTHELIVTRSKQEQMKVFLHGRSDLITGNEFTIARALAEAGHCMNDVVPLLMMNERGYYLAANKETDPVLVKRLRQANAKIQQGDFPGQCIKKYMQPLQKKVSTQKPDCPQSLASDRHQS